MYRRLFNNNNLLSITIICLCALLVASLLTPATAAQSRNRKSIGRYIYVCEGGLEVKVDVYQNIKSGKHQVVVGLPSGTTIAMDQTPSASGVRFSDEVGYVFWMRGNNAILQARDDKGEWVRQYGECQYR